MIPTLVGRPGPRHSPARSRSRTPRLPRLHESRTSRRPPRPARPRQHDVLQPLARHAFTPSLTSRGPFTRQGLDRDPRLRGAGRVPPSPRDLPLARPGPRGHLPQGDGAQARSPLRLAPHPRRSDDVSNAWLADEIRRRLPRTPRPPGPPLGQGGNRTAAAAIPPGRVAVTKSPCCRAALADSPGWRRHRHARQKDGHSGPTRSSIRPKFSWSTSDPVKGRPNGPAPSRPPSERWTSSNPAGAIPLSSSRQRSGSPPSRPTAIRSPPCKKHVSDRPRTGTATSTSRRDTTPTCMTAFRAYGMDLATLPVEEASRRIRSSRISEALISALDDWAANEPSNVPGSRLEAIRPIVRNQQGSGRAPRPHRPPRRDPPPPALRRGRRPARVETSAPLCLRFPAEARPAGSLRQLEGHPSRLPLPTSWLNHDLGMIYLEARPTQRQVGQGDVSLWPSRCGRTARAPG